MYNLNGYIQALKDEEAGVRAPASLALGQIGKPAVAELIKACIMKTVWCACALQGQRAVDALRTSVSR